MPLIPFAFPARSLLVFGLAGCLAAPAFAADGHTVYGKTCAACHASGVANAPKLGDKAGWAPRLAMGRPALLTSVLKGKGVMPARAGHAGLTDEEIQAALDFMLAAVK